MSLPSASFRACPECVIKDIGKWGDPYLHRTHHLPGIDFCVEHRRRLVSIGNKYTGVQEMKRRMECLGISDESLADVPEDLARHLQDAISHLFNRPIQLDEELDFMRLYRYSLDLRRVTRNGWQAQVIDAIRSKYRGEAGELVQLDRWIHKLKPALGWGGLLPPVAHLVLQHFLGLTTEVAMRHADGCLWDCPNPVTNCGPAYSPRIRTVSNFGNEQVECSKCGFAARFVQTTPLGTKPKIKSIVSRGFVFESYIRDGLKQGIPANTLRRPTGLTKVAFGSILQDFGYSKPRGGRASKSSVQLKLDRKRDECRDALLGYMEQNPGVSRTQIFRRFNKVCIWLLTHDREWYDAHAPSSRNRGRYRVRALNCLPMAPASVGRLSPKLNSIFQDLITESGNSKT